MADFELFITVYNVIILLLYLVVLLLLIFFIIALETDWFDVSGYYFT